jgi:single-strand DNA-binding protein
VNKVILFGRLGKDPEELKSKVPGARFSVATTESYKKKGEDKRQERTDWHSIQTWGDQAKFALKWLKKGMLVLLEGKLTYNEVNGKTYTNIIAKVIQPVWPPKGEQGQDKAAEPDHDPLEDAEHSSDDDIPF